MSARAPKGKISAAVKAVVRLARIRRARRVGKKSKSTAAKKDPTLFVYCDQFLE